MIQSEKFTKPQGQWLPWLTVTHLGYGLVGSITILSSVATALDLGLVELMELQVQTLFRIQHITEPPENVVILAIDEESLSQGEFYGDDPQGLAHLEPLSQWPWKRSVYGTVIDKLMKAGAKTVAVDLLLDRPSSYGKEDDQTLQNVLDNYPGQITLAASYEEDKTRSGDFTYLIEPASSFQTESISIGFINFFIEQDGRIHRLGRTYPSLLTENLAEAEKKVLEDYFTRFPSFAEATLKAANLEYPRPQGDYLFFYGHPRSFARIPFWHVLDPENWNSYLQGGKYFQDKIVLIGATATIFQDLHQTPFSSRMMPGVEVHGNAIATLLEDRSLAEMIPHPIYQGGFIFILISSIGFGLSRLSRWTYRFGGAMVAMICVGGVSYYLFVIHSLIVPTAVPLVAILLIGFSHGTLGAIKEVVNKLKLRQTLKNYVSAPIVKEIITHAEDLQDLLSEQEKELLSRKLEGRYQILRELSSGGFGTTYVAKDTQRPGNPSCVVKKLQPRSNDPRIWKLAQRLFIREAETLEKLGQHPQIPQLLAYLPQGECREFYLVEELIVGHSLTQEIGEGDCWSEAQVIALLGDLLPVLEFIHSNGVIHRDIKPSNIIRRQSDGKLILIDFGAVKEQVTNPQEDQTQLTIGIGTKGYMPPEQSAGRPQFNSDIYGLGIIALQTLTGTSPHHFVEEATTGEILWNHHGRVHETLWKIMTRMIRQDWRDRYSSAQEVLEDLDVFSAPEFSESQPTINSSNLPPTEVSMSNEPSTINDEF